MMSPYPQFNQISFNSQSIVLFYPFFDKGFTTRQFDKLNLVAFGQLVFTVLMDFRDFLRG